MSCRESDINIYQLFDVNTYFEVLRGRENVDSLSRDVTQGRDSPLRVDQHGAVSLHQGAVREAVHHLDMAESLTGWDQSLVDLGTDILLVRENPGTANIIDEGARARAGVLLGLASILVTEDGEVRFEGLNKRSISLG